MSVCASPRSVALAMVGASLVVLCCGAPSARAQPPVAVWAPSPEATPARYPVEAETDPAVVHRRVPRRGLLGTGVVVSSLAFTGALIWGAYFLADLQLGVPNCNDQYGAWHFVPLVGPAIGAISGATCLPDAIHLEEIIMPAIFSAGQLAALMLFAAGAIGHEVDVPVIDVTANAQGAMVRVGGRF